MKIRWNFCFAVTLSLLFAVSGLFAQNTPKVISLYRVPVDSYLVFVLTPPENNPPVQLENFQILLRRDVDVPFIKWEMRNNSTKTVKSFSVFFKIRTNVDELHGTGGGSGVDISTDDPAGLIPPSDSYKAPSPSLELPDDLRKMFSYDKNTEERKLIVVYAMIKKVIFTDGTTYEAKSTVFEDF